MLDAIHRIVTQELADLDALHVLQLDAAAVLTAVEAHHEIDTAIGNILKQGPMSLEAALLHLAKTSLKHRVSPTAQEEFIDELMLHLDDHASTAPAIVARPAPTSPKVSRAELLSSPELQPYLAMPPGTAVDWQVFSSVGLPLVSEATVADLFGNPSALAKKHALDAGRLVRLQERMEALLANALAGIRRNEAAEQQWLAGLGAWPEDLSEQQRAAFAALQTKLLGARAELRKMQAVPPQGFPAVDLVHRERAPVVSSRYDRANTAIDLRGGFFDAEVRFDKGKDDAQVIGTIDAVLRAMHQRGYDLSQWLRTAAEQTPWASLLSALDVAATVPDDASSKSVMSWRISMKKEGGLGMAAYVHKPTKKGYSSGSRVDLHRLHFNKSLALLDQDEKAARVFDRASYSGPDALELVLALRNHPRVFFEDDLARAVDIKIGQVGLSLITERERLQLRATIDGHVLDLARSVEDNVVFRAVPERAQLLVAALDQRQANLLTTLHAYQGAQLPAQAQEPVLERLQRLEGLVPVSLPEGLRGDARPADTAPLVRIKRRAAAFEVSIRVRPLTGGLALAPGAGPVEISALVEGVRVHTSRDFAQEHARALDLREQLALEAEGDDAFQTLIADEQRMLALLATLRERPEVTVEWADDDALRLTPGQATARTLHIRVRAGKDWFRLEGELAVDEQRIALARVLDAARRGQRFVALDTGLWVELEQSLRERVQALEAMSHETRGAHEVGIPAIAALDALEELGADCDTPSRWRELRDKMRAAQSTPPELPLTLQAELRPYQEEGFRWLMQRAAWGVGACLADDMGLGKTVQALAAILARAAGGPTLVVAPTSVCFNWRNECARFAPSLTVFAYERGAPSEEMLAPGALIVASYGAMMRNIDTLSAHVFSTIVFDEAHALKNHDAQRTQAARRLQADWLFALTGTPVENRLGELWSLFNVLSPGLFGSSDQFRERFAIPIERDRDAHRRRALSGLCRQFILRRTKAVVAPELPPKTEIDVPITLSAEEQRMYDDARIAAQDRLARGESKDARFALLAALTRLRMLACHPRLYDVTSPLPSTKLASFLQLTEDLIANHHRALVFSQFTKHLAVVREALDERHIPYQYLDGSTPAPQREAAVKAFQCGEGALFLVSVQAGGTGLNLTAADYVIHLDPWWNPAVEDQATGRAHRIGQDKPVTVYRLFSQRTIEERILALHRDKRELAATVFDENAETSAGVLSVDELMTLAFG